MQKKSPIAATGKTKTPEKKKATGAAAKVKTVEKKETKKTAAVAKHPAIKKKKAPIPIKTKSTPKKVAKEIAKPIAITRIVTHGKDRHFIPAHTQQSADNVHDSNAEENVFHNREEVALKQEEQKVKDSAISKTNVKRIFNSQGRR